MGAEWLPIHIRRGTADDADQCQHLTRTYRPWFPFVMRVSLIEAAERGELLIAEVDGMFAGFVSYRTRRDGWHTVYELATMPEWAGQGVGRALLYAVPTPIRLKTTADNVDANRFYVGAGMQLVRTEDAARPLNVYEMRVLCVHVHGNNRRVQEWARAAGMAYGTRHDDTARAWPLMLDINWRKYIWAEYLAKIAQYRPVMAMVADYEHPNQRETMLKQVADLRAAGVLRVLVCPKFHGAVADIPDDCIVAVSIPSRYAGFVPAEHELTGRRIHLLGGSPSKQRDAVLRWNVVSADYNAHQRAAQFGVRFEGGRWNRNVIHTGKTQEYDATVIENGRAIRTMLNEAAAYHQPGLFTQMFDGVQAASGED